MTHWRRLYIMGPSTVSRLFNCFSCVPLPSWIPTVWKKTPEQHQSQRLAWLFLASWANPVFLAYGTFGGLKVLACSEICQSAGL